MILFLHVPKFLINNLHMYPSSQICFHMHMIALFSAGGRGAGDAVAGCAGAQGWAAARVVGARAGSAHMSAAHGAG